MVFPLCCPYGTLVFCAKVPRAEPVTDIVSLLRDLGPLISRGLAVPIAPLHKGVQAAFL